jgi:hypothetical protein
VIAVHEDRQRVGPVIEIYRVPDLTDELDLRPDISRLEDLFPQVVPAPGCVVRAGRSGIRDAGAGIAAQHADPVASAST